MLTGFIFLGIVVLIVVLVKNKDSICSCIDSCKEKTEKLAEKLRGQDRDHEPGDYLEI